MPAGTQARARGHGREAGHPCAAQELDQHRFELVVAVVSGQQPLAVRKIDPASAA